MTPSPRPRPSSIPPVQYKGGELDAARGPGLGCFWVQIVVLAILVVLTPVGVNLGWPDWLNALLLFATIGLLLVSGQTIIFLLRIVAAERREGRRRPMAVGRTATVGELEDEAGPSAAGWGPSGEAAPGLPARSEPTAAAAQRAPGDLAHDARTIPNGPGTPAAPHDLSGDEPMRE